MGQLTGVIIVTTLVWAVLVGLLHKYVEPEKEDGDEYRVVAESLWARPGKVSMANHVLLVTRICSFCWFFCLAWVYRWVTYDPNYWYFTIWNIILLSLYFLAATICSVQFFLDPDNKQEISFLLSPSKRAQMAVWLKTASDVTGSCALFVSVVAFGVLDNSMEFWNVTFHLTNSLFFLVETAQNSIRAQPRNCLVGLVFMYVYVVFAWILVAGAQIRPWPYFFLNTEYVIAYGWYIGLQLFYMLFFVFWLGIVKQKFKIFGWCTMKNAPKDIALAGDPSDGVSLVTMDSQSKYTTGTGDSRERQGTNSGETRMVDY